MCNRLLSVCILLTVFAVVCLRATDYYVDPIVEHETTVTFRTIVAAVAAAADEDNILLKAGSIFTGTGNRNITLSDKTLTFGRYGTGDNPVIDLESNGRFLDVAAGRIVMMHLNIRRGSANEGGGGALRVSGSALAISDCTFDDNVGNPGGAIYVGVSDLFINDCTFVNNDSNSGGAIRVWAGSLVQINYCRFARNKATSSGSAIATDVSIDAQYNWWGSNNPDFSSLLYGSINHDNHITMSLASNHTMVGETGSATVSFTKTSTGTIPSCPITFSMTDGVIASSDSMVVNGQASASFVASNTSARLCAQVDDQILCTYVVGPITVGSGGMYADIQSSVSSAASGDSILLKAGQTFTGADNRNITLSGKTLTFGRYGTGDDPVIDLQTSGRLFDIQPSGTINSNITMEHLNIRNGWLENGNGGICHVSYGSLTARYCTFANSRAGILGGAIYADTNTSTVDVQYCTFIKNTANAGGAMYVNSGDIHNCRFAGNIATSHQGSAIAASTGTVNAQNNWWGTNLPGGGLFYNSVLYNPYITASLSASPSTITPGGSSDVTLSFTPTGIPNITASLSASPSTITPGGSSDVTLSFTPTGIPSTPITFSATDGTVTLTSVNTTDSVATTTFTAGPSDLLTVTSIVGPGYEAYPLELTFTVSGANPGIAIKKKINDSPLSTAAPGVVVPSGSMMNISYLVTNTGNINLNVKVTDDHGYSITPSTTTLGPSESVTCTAQSVAPGIHGLHYNVGTAKGTTPGLREVVATSTAYATSVPVGPYRCNFGCICSDAGDIHAFIASDNNLTMTDNKMYFFRFYESMGTATVGSIGLGSRFIMDSATYNTSCMNIVLLTQEQTGSMYIEFVKYDGDSITGYGPKSIPSRAFKSQWALSSGGIPYIFVDQQDGMSLYRVNLNTYDITLSSSVPNLAAGGPSAFLRWYTQNEAIYIIQGYNRTSIATYKVDLNMGILEPGVATDLSGDFSAINSCSSAYNSLVLGGTYGSQGRLVKYSIDGSGRLIPALSKDMSGTTAVTYCERCGCGGDPILVATDNGLYSVNPDGLDIRATYTGDSWINACWCCDSNGDYCMATKNDNNVFVFKETGTSLALVTKVLFS